MISNIVAKFLTILALINPWLSFKKSRRKMNRISLLKLTQIKRNLLLGQDLLQIDIPVSFGTHSCRLLRISLHLVQINLINMMKISKALWQAKSLLPTWLSLKQRWQRTSKPFFPNLVQEIRNILSLISATQP